MKTQKIKKVATAIAATLALTTIPTLTFAEKQDEAKEAASINVITVTARKRAENMQDVPAAVSAFSADDLVKLGIENITDIQNVTPNVTISETKGLNPGTIQVFIRGIGNDPGFDQGVGIYVDDVYLNRTAGALLDVYDIERIEVLKGPQGHLYGRNTIGGALKYISKDPDSETRGKFEVKVGSDNLVKIRTGLSGGLSQNLYAGLSVSVADRDGYQTNTFDGTKYAGQDTTSARGTLIWEASDDFTLKLVADYHKDDSSPHVPRRISLNQEGLGTFQTLLTLANNFIPGSAYLAPGEVIDATIDPVLDNVNTENVDGFNQYELESTTIALTAKWDINEQWAFKSVTSSRTLDNVQPFDFDGSDQLFIRTINYREQTDQSQEFQFNYSSDDVNGVFGLYYLDGDRENPGITHQTPLLRLLSSHVKDNTKDTRTLKSTSVYGNVDWDITDKLQLSMGARWTKDEKELDSEADVTLTQHVVAFSTFTGPAPMVLNPAFASTWASQPFFTFFIPHFSSTGAFIGDGSTESVDVFEEDKRGSASWSKFTPSVNLSYKVADDVMIYAGYATGFKSGGFNTQGAALLAEEYEPETVDTLSFGFKSQWNDGTFRLNGEVFHNIYSDKQFSTIVLEDSGALVQSTDNVGEVIATGFELESSFIFPQVDGLSLNIGVGYLNNEIDQFIEQQEVSEGSGTFTGVNVADNYELGFSPKWTSTVQVAYEFYLDDADIIWTANASYRDDAWTSSPIDITNDFEMTQLAESHTMYSSSLTYVTEDENWRVRIEGKNLTDERVLVHSFNVSNVNLGGYTRERTWELTLGYNF